MKKQINKMKNQIILPKGYSIEKDEYNNMYNLYKDGERVIKTINIDQAIRYANDKNNWMITK
jgi:hypothetical protein